MADLNEQMTSLLEKEELPYADDATAATDYITKPFARETRKYASSPSKPFNPIESQALLESYKPEIKEKRQEDRFEENIDTAKSIGTGLATGIFGLPSDVIEGVNFVNDYLAEQGSPKAIIFKDALNKVREDFGREAFDKKFTEITGIKSDASNIDQIVGEILSPAGAIVATVKGGVKATQGAIKLYGFLQEAFETQTKLLRGNIPPGGTTQLVTGNVDNTATQMGNINQIKNKEIAAAAVDAAKTTKTVDSGDPNRPIINLNEIGLKTQGGQDAVKKYRALEKNLFKQRGTEYTRKNYYELPNSIKDDLYRQTGVYRGKEGAFRYKISTAEAQLNVGSLKQQGIIESGTSVVTRFNASKIPTEGITLEEMLNFQPLYIQYGKKENNFFEGIAGSENPEQFNLLKNIKVKSMDDFVNLRVAEGMSITEAEKLKNTTSAVYSVRGSEEIIYVSSNSLTKVRSDILHEVQHAIQKREGFLPGGSPSSILDDMTDGNYSLDVQKLGDDQKQILADYYKDYPNLSNNMKNIFKSATTKLIQREFKYMYKNGENLKDTKDVLPTNAGTYRVNLDDDINNISYNNKAITFTEEEATLLNAVADRSNFKSYMTFRAVTERQSIRLLKLEEQAIIKYRYKTGEMQSRRVEKQDALYQEIVQGLRDKGQLGKNEIVSPELQERIFRGIGLDDAGEYKDMFPSKFEGQGVLQDQKIKPAGTNINTYANIKEQ